MNIKFSFFLLLSTLVVGCSKNGSKPSQNSNNTDAPKTGTISVFAGNGQSGSEDGKGVASFSGSYGIVMDKNGNLFVSDYNTTLIRKVTPDGTVTTLAGHVTGTSIDGTGTNASFKAPAGMAIDGDGNLFVADNLVIRKVTPAGVVTTVAGSNYNSNSRLTGVIIDASGNLYASDAGNKVILKISNGINSVYAAGSEIAGLNNFEVPLSLVFDSKGNLFVEDSDDAIREIGTDKAITTIAGVPRQPGFVNGAGNQATFFNLACITRDAANNLFVSDYGNRAIREILPDGNVSTVVLTNDNNTGNGPEGMVFDSSGNMYVAEGASILKVTLK
jgi:sugar lactone lactonase YvrE